tara:strand:- start:769 stop:1950 length:1182 start_codon:yes stop_codon:yes gene_type:complete
MIASMNALYFCSKIFDNKDLKDGFEKRKKEVLDAQTNEGWFPEYNGADIGYSFIALDLFANYLDETKDPKVVDAVSKLIRFIIRFLHPDGTVGCIYSSRSTNHVVPYGLKFFSEYDIPEAKYLYNWYNHHKNANQVIDPLQTDDKYFSYFYFNSYAQASSMREIPPPKNNSKFFQFDFIERFDHAGLLRYEKNDLKAFIGWKKGGVCNIFYDGNLVYSDSGYIFKLSNGILGSTQILDENAKVSWDKTKSVNELTILGNSGRIDNSLPLVKWVIPFKVFCKTVLRFDSIGYWFNKRLKKTRVKKQYPLPVSMIRIMIFEENEIIINDNLKIDDKSLTFSDIMLTRDVSTTHSPSSRFFQYQNFLNDIKPIESKIMDRTATFEYKISFAKDHNK